ncbi:MAG: DMT family transporter [Bacteroidales bacterium]|nr:DMT family transporter [Bacteroidales bacterium]
MQNIIYLIIHILFAIGMFISLKVVNVKKVNKFQAIAVNYFVAMIFTLGDLIFGDVDIIFPSKLIVPSLIVGTLFVTSFIVMTYSTQKVGIGLTTALNKMSVVLPVSVGILYLGQNSGLFLKVAGIILALASFVLILYKKSEKRVKGAFILPAMVFILSGMIDTSMELTNNFALSKDGERELFLLGIFITAFLLSALSALVTGKSKSQEIGFGLKTIAYGSILGLFNFLTSKMILVNVARMGGSVVFPIHNASVVMITALIGVLFFKEVFTRKQWIGVILAIIAVFIIANTMQY